jgi:hypothetical protein
MFLTVSLSGLLGMVASVVCMATRGVGVVGGLLVLTTLMMLRGFAVVTSSVAQMLRCLLVVFCCFLRHESVPSCLPIGLASRECRAK